MFPLSPFHRLGAILPVRANHVQVTLVSLPFALSEGVTLPATFKHVFSVSVYIHTTIQYCTYMHPQMTACSVDQHYDAAKLDIHSMIDACSSVHQC